MLAKVYKKEKVRMTRVIWPVICAHLAHVCWKEVKA